MSVGDYYKRKEARRRRVRADLERARDSHKNAIAMHCNDKVIDFLFAKVRRLEDLYARVACTGD